MIHYLAVQIAAQLEYRYVHCRILKIGDALFHELDGHPVKPVELPWQIFVDDDPTDQQLVQAVVSDVMHRVSVVCNVEGGSLAAVTIRDLQHVNMCPLRDGVLVTAWLSVTAI